MLENQILETKFPQNGKFSGQNFAFFVLIAENYPTTRNFFLKIPNRLQIATWLIQTVYRKLPTPYQTLPSLTPKTYCLATTHALQKKWTDRQTDRQPTSGIISATVSTVD